MRPRTPQGDDPVPARRSRPGELRRLVLSARHAVADRFDARGVPVEARGAVLRRAVDDLVRHCHRTEQPRRLFLELLDDHCARHVAAASVDEEAEETDRGEGGEEG